MKKKMIYAGLAAAVLTMTGCGGKKPAETKATETVSTETVSTETVQMESTQEASEQTVPVQTESAQIETKQTESEQVESVCSFTDSTGNTVTTGNPRQAAVLFSSFAEIWKLAGGEIAVTVGESVERGFAPENAVLVDEGAGKQINLEALVAAEPDFVICSADLAAQTEAAELLRESGIPCAAFRVESFADYLSMLKICTDITGKTENYVKYGTEVEKRIQAIMEKLPIVDEKTEILFIRAGSGESSVKAKTAQDHFAAAMLQELGTHNIADDAPILLDGLSTEEILMRDPDYIFIATMGKESAAKAYMDGVIAGEAWQSLSAVKNGQYYYLPKDLFQYKPNARWDEAYRYLAQILFPEVDFS